MLIDSKDIIEAEIVFKTWTKDPKEQLRLLTTWIALIETTGYDVIKERQYMPEEVVYGKQIWEKIMEDWRKRIKKPAPEQRAGSPTSVGRRLPKKYNTKGDKNAN